MRLTPIAAALLLAGCATAPQPMPQPQPRPAPQPMPSPHIRSDLLGLTANEIAQRLGMPALQIREGAGVKLQFRGRQCVLDAYLYPPPSGHGVERVTHVDTRLRSGAPTAQAGCIAALSAP